MKTKPTHTPTPFSTKELVGNALEQVSYAMRYQHGENVKELQKACFRIAEVEPIIGRAVNAFEAYDRVIKALSYWLEGGNLPEASSLMPDNDSTFGEAIKEAIAKLEGKE